jgi:signal peptidase II
MHFKILIILILLDQVSKMFARSVKPFSVAPFFNNVHAWNPGISWGLFPCHSTLCKWILVFVELCVLTLVILWHRKSPSALERAGLLCIIAGACGNLLDRISFGAVFDFIDLHWGGWHFPAFNVADIFISMGFLILMKESLWSGKNRSF